MRSSLSAVAHTIILTWTSSRALVFPNCTHLCWLCCLCPSPAHSRPSRVPRGQRLQAAAPGPRPWLSSRREVAAGLSRAPPVPVPVPAWRSGWARSLCDHRLAVPPPAPGSHWALGSPFSCLAPLGPGVEQPTVSGPWGPQHPLLPPPHVLNTPFIEAS